MEPEKKVTELGALEALAERLAGNIPSKVSQLTNDAGYQTAEQVAAQVAAADHLTRKIVASVEDIDTEAEDADKFVYMVPKVGSENSESENRYDEYMVINGALEPVGNWAVDLSDYQKKQEGAGLYPDTDKEKLAGMAKGATKVEASETPGCVKINGADVQVVEIATDAEVNAMLDRVFGA